MHIVRTFRIINNKTLGGNTAYRGEESPEDLIKQSEGDQMVNALAGLNINEFEQTGSPDLGKYNTKEIMKVESPKEVRKEPTKSAQPGNIKFLVGKGYKREDAIEALLLTGEDIMAAMEYLANKNDTKEEIQKEDNIEISAKEDNIELSSKNNNIEISAKDAEAIKQVKI